MGIHGPVIAHCTDSEDFPQHLAVDRNFQDPHPLGVQVERNAKRPKAIQSASVIRYCTIPPACC